MTLIATSDGRYVNMGRYVREGHPGKDLAGIVEEVQALGWTHVAVYLGALCLEDWMPYGKRVHTATRFEYDSAAGVIRELVVGPPSPADWGFYTCVWPLLTGMVESA